jgi:TP901 family phage tail tape measure protein
MATVGRLNVILGAKVRGFMAGMRSAESSMTSLKERMSSVSASAMRMSAVFAGAGGAMTIVAANFEKQMTRTAAVAAGGAAGFDEAFSSMSASALDLAGRTEFTASEVAEAMGFMAMAGNDAATTIGAMPAVLQLSSAASLDLGRSADIVTNVMAGFGKETAQLIEVNNTLVATFSSSNVTLSELGEAFKTAGPVAKALGVTIEQVSQAIGLLGNAGIKGSEAGTGLKRAFTAMVNVTPKAAKAMEQLGISTSDLTDPRKGIGTVIAKLEGARSGFEKAGKSAEFTANLFQVFGERAGPKMAALIEQGADAFDDLGRKIDKAKVEDLASFLETKQVNTFRGQLNILLSSIEKVAISFGQRLIPLLDPLVQGLTKAFSAIGSWNERSIDSVVNIAKMVAGVVAAVAALAGLVATVAGVAAGLGALSTAAAGVGVTLGGAVLAPLLAVAAGLGAFMAALTMVESKTGETVDVMSTLKEALLFATEGFAQAEATVLNLVLAMGQAIVQFTTLGMMDMGGMFGDISSGFSDSAREAQDLSDEMQDVLRLEREFAELKDEIAEIGIPIKQVETEFKNLDGTMRKVNVAMVNMDAARNLMLEGDVDILPEEAVRLSQQLVRLQFDRLRALQEIQKKNKQVQDEAKSAADDALKAEQDKIRRQRERLKAELEAFRIASATLAQTKEQLKAIDQISRMRKEAARDLQLAEAGSASPVLQQAFEFEDAAERLKTAFEKAGAPLSDMEPILGDMKDALRINVQEFLSSKKGTEDFAAASKLAEKVLRRLGIETVPMVDDVVRRVGGSLEKVDRSAKEAGNRLVELFGNLKDFGESLMTGDVGGLTVGALDLSGFTDNLALTLDEFFDITASAAESLAKGIAGALGSIAGAVASFVLKALQAMQQQAIAALEATVGKALEGTGSLRSAVKGGLDVVLGSLAAAALLVVAALGVLAAIAGFPLTIPMALLALAFTILAAIVTVLTGGLTLLAGAFMFFAGFAFSLAAETKEGAQVAGAFSNAISMAAEPLGGFAEGLFALVEVVFLVTSGLSGIAASFTSTLPQLLFEAFRAIGVAVLTTALAIEGLRIEFNEQTGRMAGVIGTLILLFVELQIAVQTMLNNFASFFGMDTSAGENTLAELEANAAAQRASLMEAAAGFDDVSEGLINASDALNTLVGLDFEGAVAAGQLFKENLEDINDELGESLTNVPQGVKVALQRFRSITPGQGISPTEAAISGAQAGIDNRIVIENLFAQVADLEDFVTQADQIALSRRQEQAGGTQGQQFRNGGNF